VKLTDFGIAKASIKALETMSGVVKGRFDYMSPEQAAGGAVDQRSDLFSAGVLFYEMLTGAHPFRREGELATIDAIRKGQFLPPSEVNPDVPYALDQLVEAALRPDPRERIASATGFKEALDRFFHDAGFIFSASTLAAFVRGLFPELAGPERKSQVGDLPTRPLEPDELELEPDESSTGNRPPPAPAAVIPFPRKALTANEVAAEALRRSAAPAPTNIGDESTLIKSPAQLTAEASRPAENPFGESNTVIRSPQRTSAQPQTVRLALDPNREAATTVYPRPSDTSSTATQTPSLPPAGPAMGTAPPAGAAKPQRAPSRRPVAVPPQVHATWILVTFAAAVAAFVLGLLVGSRIHPAAPAAPGAAAPEK
jgi:serine/threonine-protein kinase